MATDHYIPQSILRRFADVDQGGSLNVFDKVDGRTFNPRVKDFGIEDFHTFTPDLQSQFDEAEAPRLETAINLAVEDPASPVLEAVVKNSTLANITPADRESLIRFIALQSIRTPGHVFRSREWHSKVFQSEEPNRSLKILGTPQKADPMRDGVLLAMSSDVGGLAQVLNRAHLALFIVPDEFAVIGDNPVVIQNNVEVPSNLFVNFPVSAPTNDAFLPISPRHILYLHTEYDAKAGTTGNTVLEPREVNEAATRYLNLLQVRSCVRYTVIPRKHQIETVMKQLDDEQKYYFNFKSLFGL